MADSVSARSRRLVNLALNNKLHEKKIQPHFESDPDCNPSEDVSSDDDEEHDPILSQDNICTSDMDYLNDGLGLQPHKDITTEMDVSNDITEARSIFDDVLDFQNDLADHMNEDNGVMITYDSLETETTDSSNDKNDSGDESEVAIILITELELFIRNIILPGIVKDATEIVDDRQDKLCTKKGELRKRKKEDSTPAERKKQKMSAEIEIHSVKEPCGEKCHFQCTREINEDRRLDINKQFWSLKNKDARNAFMFSCIKRQAKKRSTAGSDSARINTFQYNLRKANGESVHVCKVFLLTTLGYHSTNDRVLKTVRNTTDALNPAEDKRGRHPNKSKVDSHTITQHIFSFNPTISHYRPEHAPKRLYLPSDISVTKMYQDFKEKFPNFKLSYDVYRKLVAKHNISFAKLGCEECFHCEQHNLHKIEDKCGGAVALNDECEKCRIWEKHRDSYRAAREEYKKDSARAEKGEGGLLVSADLQKVIMLPRAEMFKEVIFVPRIVAYDESFVPLGKGNPKKMKPTAVIWHEAVTGRNKEDLISAFHAFILQHQDEEEITIWLDNCSAQNKNWALFCFFVHIINSPKVSLRRLVIKYLEPGHTFMSADSFHHQVEMSLKKTGKVLDFNDFVACVQRSNSGKVNVIPMSIENFSDWQDNSSKFKLKNSNPRPYLHDMVQVTCCRGDHTINFRTKFSGPDVNLNFLIARYFKTGIPEPRVKQHCRGVTLERKENILLKLRPIIKSNRLPSWENLPVSAANDVEDDD